MCIKRRHGTFLSSDLVFSSIFFVVLVSMSTFRQSVTSAQSDNTVENIIPNYGFENGTYRPWVPVLSNASYLEMLPLLVASKHVNVTTEHARNGSYALKIFNFTEGIEGGGCFGVSYEIPSSVSRNVIGYNLTFWASTGEFNDTTLSGPQGIIWAMGIGVYCADKENQVFFSTLWNPSYPTIEIANHTYWCNEWKNVTVSIPGDAELIIISVDFKRTELVPRDARIYIDDISLKPHTVSATTDKSNYYIGEVTILASILNYRPSSLEVSIQASIVMPNEFVVGPLTMNEKSLGTYSVSWTVPMRFTLSGRHFVKVNVIAYFVNWPDGQTYKFEKSTTISFVTLPLIPFVLSVIILGTIILAVIKSKWMTFEIFILLLLLLILLLY